MPPKARTTIGTRQSRGASGKFSGRSVVGVARVDITEPMRRLRAIDKTLGENLADELDNMASVMEDYAKNGVPAPVDSGAFRDSIHAEVDRRGSNVHKFQVRIKLSSGDPNIFNKRGQPTTRYAYFIEAGHSGVAPNGVIGPTYKRFQKVLPGICSRSVAQTIKNAGSK